MLYVALCQHLHKQAKNNWHLVYVFPSRLGCTHLKARVGVDAYQTDIGGVLGVRAPDARVTSDKINAICLHHTSRYKEFDG